MATAQQNHLALDILYMPLVGARFVGEYIGSAEMPTLGTKRYIIQVLDDRTEDILNYIQQHVPKRTWKGFLVAAERRLDDNTLIYTKSDFDFLTKGDSYTFEVINYQKFAIPKNSDFEMGVNLVIARD